MVGKSIWCDCGVLCLVCMSATAKRAGASGVRHYHRNRYGRARLWVAGAKVVVTNVTKGTVEEVATNENGGYSVTHLIPERLQGSHRSGWIQGARMASVRVNVDSTVRVDAQLQVGSVTQWWKSLVRFPSFRPKKPTSPPYSPRNKWRACDHSIAISRHFNCCHRARRSKAGTRRQRKPQGSRQILTNGQHFRRHRV